MCKDTLMTQIKDTEEEIERAESAISSAQYEITTLKEIAEDLKEEDHHELLTELYTFIKGLEEKTRPCRIETIKPIYSDDDPEVVTLMETTYFDWGFTDIIAKIREVL